MVKESEQLEEEIFKTMKVTFGSEFISDYIGDLDDYEEMIKEIPQPEDNVFEIARKRFLKDLKEYRRMTGSDTPK